jgi:hypothetical protein
MNILNMFTILYNYLKDALNFIFLGRIKVVIQTPQFLGSQEEFYMLKQTGWLYLTTLKFKPIRELGGNHEVCFRSIKDAHSAIVERL